MGPFNNFVLPAPRTYGKKINNTFADQNLTWRGPSSIYSLTCEPISENDSEIYLTKVTMIFWVLTLNC